MDWYKKLKNPWILASSFAVLGLVLGVIIFSGGGDDSFESIVIEKADLVAKVEVTGRVKASQNVNLAFNQTGRVSQVTVDVGDPVFRGQTLVVLENGDIFSDLNQAKANLKAEEIKLSELLKGNREEEIDIQRTRVLNAETALNDARRSLIDEVRDSLTSADDAIRNTVDQFFSSPTSASPQLNINITNGQLKINLESERLAIESLLNNWQTNLVFLNSSSDLEEFASEADQNISKVKNLVDLMSLAVNSLSPTSSLTQTTIDGYKSDVSSARSSISTSITALSSALEGFRTAESNLLVEEKELELTLAGSTGDEIAIQEARAEAARATVSGHEARLLKTIIRAPISGTVTEQEAKIGEIVSAGENIVSLISESDFEIESNVPEADISTVLVGQKADVTLDAYDSDEIFRATVTSVNPAESIIDGVATYKTTLQFDERDERIRSGMTANVEIITAEKQETFSVPRRAVIRENGDKFVRIVKNGVVEKVRVTTGISGFEGNIEIISGLNEGDTVITFFEE